MADVVDVTDKSDFLPFLLFDFALVLVSREGVGDTATNLCPYFRSSKMLSASQFRGLPFGPFREYDA